MLLSPICQTVAMGKSALQKCLSGKTKLQKALFFALSGILLKCVTFFAPFSIQFRENQDPILSQPSFGRLVFSNQFHA